MKLIDKHGLPRLMCCMLVLGFLACNGPPPPPVNMLQEKLRKAASEMAAVTLGQIDRYSKRERLYVQNISLETHCPGENNIQNGLTRRFARMFQQEMAKKSNIRIITPFSVSPDSVLGQCRIDCGSFRLPEMNVRLCLETEYDQIRVRLDEKLLGRNITLPGSDKIIAVNGLEKEMALSWQAEKETLLPDGSASRPFERFEDAGIYLAKVLCCSLDKLDQRLDSDYRIDFSKMAKVYVPQFTALGQMKSVTFMGGLTESFRHDLGECCPKITHTASGPHVDKALKGLSDFQGPVYLVSPLH
jgi:hypothetical protein